MTTTIINGKMYNVDEAYATAFNGIEYFAANAYDEQGNMYHLTWDIVNPDADEVCDMCDWDNPSDIELVEAVA